MKQFFYLFLVVLLLASCGLRRNPCNRAARILHHNPQCVSTDTVWQTKFDTIPGQVIYDSVPVEMSDQFVDSLKITLREFTNVDSLVEVIYRQAVKSIKIQPLNDTTDTYILNIWVERGKLFYKNEVFPTVVETKHPTAISSNKPTIIPEKPDRWLLRILSFIIAVLSFLLVKNIFSKS